MQKIDIIIVGGGLSGTILAFHLIKKGYKIIVFDEPYQNNSSRIAAGLFHPLAPRIYSDVWMADKIFPYMEDFYTKMEKIFFKKIFFKKKLYRPIKNNNIVLKSKFAQIIKDHKQKYINEKNIISIQRAGYVDINTFLNESFKILNKKNLLILDKFDTNHLILKNENITYKNFKTKKLIFCDGNKIFNNPFFKNLNFKLVKGQLFIAKKIDNFDFIINKSIWGFINNNDDLVMGATFDRENLHISTDITQMNTLVTNFKKLTKIKFGDIIESKVGLRPATYDRRPIIGFHDKHKNIGIFNGFGSKGVSMIPLFAKLFVNEIFYKKQFLPKEVMLRKLLCIL